MTKIEQKLHEIAAGDVLDIATGCGPNIRTVAPLLKSYDSMIGVDLIVPRLIRAAKEEFTGFPRVYLAGMDAYQLAFPDNSFDFVMISNSLHHLDRPEQVLREMVRVTRPGGRVLVREMFRDNPTPLQESHILLHHWWAAIDHRAGIVHNEMFWREDIAAMCTSAGLHELNILDDLDKPIEPMDAESIEQLGALIDTYPDKIPDHPDRPRLVEEGAKIKLRLNEIGLAWSAELWVFGRK